MIHKQTVTSASPTASAAVDLGPDNDYVLQADAACHVGLGDASTFAATAANGFKLAADGSMNLRTGSSFRWLSVLSATGTANVKVFRVASGDASLRAL